MAYVPGYDHDVFVSYAHLDDQGEGAWVTNLVRHLETEVRPRLGAKDLRIWIDHELDGNHPLTPEIMQAIRRSATILLIMSPSYIASEWCARERNAFLSVARDCVSEGRIFIVRCREVDRQYQPSEFGDLIGFKFWTHDADAGGVMRPLGLADQKEPAYFTAVINLADKLTQKLNEIRAARIGAPSSVPAAVEHLFVARSADDMERREEELVSHLTQAGLRVLPETWYREDSEQDFRAAMQADLQRCSVFVQLLGGLAGRRATRFAEGRRFPAIQHDIAREVGKPILQWRDLAVDPAAVEDECHRALLEGARTGGFEEFKRAVVEASRRKVQTPRSRTADVAVFVNADRADLEIARNLSALLAEQGVMCSWPIAEGSPEKVRQDLEENLRDCDGLVLIYGTTEPAWVRNQLLQGRKILGQRDRPLVARAICLGPPPEKIELAVALPDLITLDGRNGVTPQMLRPFVERLTLEA
jgi:TIR domain